jgi:hypothetical protein
MTAYDSHERLVERYELAYERAVLAREEWAAAGSPFTMTFANRMVGAHPLWTALRQAEHDAAAALERVRVKHRGPSPKAVVEPTIGPSPAEKLRRVK